MAVDPIILDFRANTSRIQKALAFLEKKFKSLGKEGKDAGEELGKGLDDAGKKAKNTSKEISVLQKGLNTLAKRIVAAFAVERIIQFTAEAVKLARTAQGVEVAFKNIAGANLNSLRRATRGTVSDLQLMQNAVQAQNLGLPIEELGNLFAFATQRARETGESVDFLTNSIVTGIGRKSPLILDNLGISAVALKEALGGVSTEAASVAEVTAAVSKIIEGEMANAIDSGVNESQRFSASIENLTVAIGEKLIPVVDFAAAELSDFAEGLTMALTEQDISIFQKFALVFENFNPALGQVADATRISQQAMNDYKDEINETQSAIVAYLDRQAEMIKKSSVAVPIIKTLKDELQRLNEELENATSQNQINTILAQIQAKEEEVDRILGKKLEKEKKITKEKYKQNGLVKRMIFQEREDDALDSQDAALEREAENARTVEDTLNEIYDEAFNKKLERNEAEMDAEEQKTQFYKEQQQQRLGAAVGFFGALAELAAVSGKRNKEFAIFEATINAALAITRAFADGGIADPVTRAIYVATVTAKTLGQLAAIKAQPVPSFYKGTDFVSDSPSKGRRRDDVAARLHYGEAVITANANKRNKGLSRALNKGTELDWIHSHHVLPALLAQKKDFEKQQKRDFATAITQSMALNMPDERIVREVKRSRLVQQAILEAYKTTGKRNPYRA